MPYGLVVERFYRVLFHDHGGAMINDWNAERYISFNGGASHPAWQGIWNQNHSGNWRDYPLYFSAGLFAREAIVAFLAAAQAHGGFEGWTEDEKYHASQLVGVAAFRCPLGAVRYAENAEALEPPLVATFDGLFVWCLPEEVDTGVQALVIKPVGDPVLLAEFREQHRIQPPPDQQGGDAELPFVDG